jgi:DNA-binding FrmR family transcriptional regulator
MDQCKPIIDHISRLEGQLKKLKQNITEHQSCEDMVPLALAVSKSFSSLKTKMLQQAMIHQFQTNITEQNKETFDYIFKLSQ